MNCNWWHICWGILWELQNRDEYASNYVSWQFCLKLGQIPFNNPLLILPHKYLFTSASLSHGCFGDPCYYPIFITLCHSLPNGQLLPLLVLKFFSIPLASSCSNKCKSYPCHTTDWNSLRGSIVLRIKTKVLLFFSSFIEVWLTSNIYI